MVRSVSSSVRAQKKALCEAPVLAFPVKDAMFVLYSDRVIDGVLSQLIPVEVNPAGETKYKERVLAYELCTLDVNELRYCTTRKELFAVVWFMRYFQPYLHGREFIGYPVDSHNVGSPNTNSPNIRST
jgi:hypothetical protein